MWIVEEYDAPFYFFFSLLFSVPHSNAKWRFPDRIRFRSLFNQDSRGLVRGARAIWRWRIEVARQQLAKEMPKEENLSFVKLLIHNRSEEANNIRSNEFFFLSSLVSKEEENYSSCCCCSILAFPVSSLSLVPTLARLSRLKNSWERAGPTPSIDSGG